MARIKKVESALGDSWVILATKSDGEIIRGKSDFPLSFKDKIQAMKACKLINTNERKTRANKEFKFTCTVRLKYHGRIVDTLFCYEKTKAQAKKFFKNHIRLKEYLGNTKYSITFVEEKTKIQ